MRGDFLVMVYAAVMVCAAGMVSGCGVSEYQQRQIEAQSRLNAQVYDGPCEPLQQTAHAWLFKKGYTLKSSAAGALETEWRVVPGSTYRRRHFAQFVLGEGPTCRVTAYYADRSPNDTLNTGELDEVARDWYLEREVMRVHAPQAYATLPIVEFW